MLDSCANSCTSWALLYPALSRNIVILGASWIVFSDLSEQGFDHVSITTSFHQKSRCLHKKRIESTYNIQTPSSCICHNRFCAFFSCELPRIVIFIIMNLVNGIGKKNDILVASRIFNDRKNILNKSFLRGNIRSFTWNQTGLFIRTMEFFLMKRLSQLCSMVIPCSCNSQSCRADKVETQASRT